MNAYYTATNELIRELPLKLCTYDPVTDKIMKEDFSFPFDYICEMPETTADSCGQQPNIRCDGEPYSDSYFEVQGGVTRKRHSGLFILYSFDAIHTDELKVPKLLLENCSFSGFVDKYIESLIQHETTNLWMIPRDNSLSDGQGHLVQLGSDQGINLTISSCTFEYMRFCKGLIVYRPTSVSIG